MRCSHEVEKKLYRAVSTLASGKGSLRDKLCNAFLVLHSLRTQDFPKILQEDFETLKRALTKSDMPCDEEEESRVRATTSTMSNVEVAQWEEKILEMYDKISR